MADSAFLADDCPGRSLFFANSFSFSFFYLPPYFLRPALIGFVARANRPHRLLTCSLRCFLSKKWPSRFPLFVARCHALVPASSGSPLCSWIEVRWFEMRALRRCEPTNSTGYTSYVTNLLLALNPSSFFCSLCGRRSMGSPILQRCLRELPPLSPQFLSPGLVLFPPGLMPTSNSSNG